MAYANAMVIDAPIGWPVGTSTITYDDLSIGVSVKSLNTLNVYSTLNTEKFNLKWVAIGY